MKYWEVLLTKQRERGKDGLTIPFLIGSQNYLPSIHIRQDIEGLILDIVSSNTFETCLRYCMGTQTFILEIRKPRNSVFFPTYKTETQSNFSVSVFSKDDLGDNVEKLIAKLIERFQDVIDEGKFSAVSNVDARQPDWRPFSGDDDIPFIKNSFKSL